MSAAFRSPRRPPAGGPPSPGDVTARGLPPPLARGQVTGNDEQASLFAEPSANGQEDIGWNARSTGREPLRFVIPPKTPVRECSSCGAAIYWVVTHRARRMPLDADGTSHFATCPDAAQHRGAR